MVPTGAEKLVFVATTDDSSDTPSGVTNDASHPPAGVK